MSWRGRYLPKFWQITNGGKGGELFDSFIQYVMHCSKLLGLFTCHNCHVSGKGRRSERQKIAFKGWSHHALADLGGVPGARHHLWHPILLFLQTFSLKSARIRGPRPTLTGAWPPTGNPGSATAIMGFSVADPEICPGEAQ